MESKVCKLTSINNDCKNIIIGTLFIFRNYSMKWSEEHDLMLCREVLVVQPFKHPLFCWGSTKKRWETKSRVLACGRPALNEYFNFLMDWSIGTKLIWKDSFVPLSCLCEILYFHSNHINQTCMCVLFFYFLPVHWRCFFKV